MGNSLEKMSSESMNLTLLLNQICKHDEYCSIKKTLNKAHCSRDYARTCQTAKFYERYGKDYLQLGIGATVNLGGADNSTKTK